LLAGRSTQRGRVYTRAGPHPLRKCALEPSRRQLCGWDKIDRPAAWKSPGQHRHERLQEFSSREIDGNDRSLTGSPVSASQQKVALSARATARTFGPRKDAGRQRKELNCCFT
jgi:hypothetical protein